MPISVPILALVVSIAYMIISRLMLGRQKRKVYETKGKNLQIWGLVIIGIIAISIILFVVDIFNNQMMKWFWLSFLTLTLGFQSWLEWKFLKGSKEYKVSLSVLLIGIIYIFVFIF